MNAHDFRFRAFPLSFPSPSLFTWGITTLFCYSFNIYFTCLKILHKSTLPRKLELITDISSASIRCKNATKAVLTEDALEGDDGAQGKRRHE